MTEQFYLYCRKCGAESSTTPGDYWNTPLWHVFQCCRVNMWLVERHGRFEGDTVRARRVTVAMLGE